tara:strand:+ start:842 stop:1009 length:168 start_codon:yes stop_codon:yes gene_type:complete
MDFNERENAIADEAAAHQWDSATDEERAEAVAFVATVESEREARRLASVDDGVPF